MTARTLPLVLGVCIALAASARITTAQWSNVPDRGVSRRANGDPLAAAPRTRTGKPDLSGVWVLEATTDPGLLGLPYGPEFFNIGASLDGGLPYQPWAAASVQKAKESDRATDPLTQCLPIGPVRSHTITFYREVIQLPRKIVILNEYNTTYRQIFTDGRPLPTDPVATQNGYSSGKWAGDTLVVQTVGLRDGLWLDNFGSPLTEAARLTERFRRPSFGKLEIALTVDDPKAYTRSWTVTLHQRLAPNTELFDAVCNEEQLDALRGAPPSGR